MIEPIMPVRPEELGVRVERTRHQRPEILRDRLKKIEEVRNFVLGASCSLVTPQDRRERERQRFEPRLETLLLIEPAYRPMMSRGGQSEIPTQKPAAVPTPELIPNVH